MGFYRFYQAMALTGTELGPQTARLRSLRVRPRPFSVLSLNLCVQKWGTAHFLYGEKLGKILNQRIFGRPLAYSISQWWWTWQMSCPESSLVART
jgi:hypothetical protein